MATDIAALVAAADLPAIVGSSTTLQQRGEEWIARCVFHQPDKHPSLSLYRKNGKWNYRCFSCGAAGDALDWIEQTEGLPTAEAAKKLNGGTVWTPKVEASPAQRKPKPERITSKPPPDAGLPNMTLRQFGDPSMSWTYRDSDGQPLGYVARYQGDGKKEIRCWTWGQRGDEPPGWRCGHWSKLRPLYGLERIAAARQNSQIVIVEGEKAADAAQALLPNLTVVTWPGGAQAWKYADWKPLTGHPLVLWPDADDPGRQAMQAIADLATDPKGLACTAKIIRTADLEAGFDAADWQGDNVLAWLKDRAEVYVRQDVRQENPEIPQNAPESPESDAIPLESYQSDPPVDNSVAASSAKARSKKRPQLAAVDGNTVKQPSSDAEPLPAALSEDALADHFAVQHSNWRYVKAWNAWFEWRADGWYRDETALIDRLAVKVTREAIYWPEAAALTLPSKQKINSKRTAGNLRDIASNDRRIAACVEQWDTHTMLLGVPGGVVDLATGQIMPARAELYITKRTSVAPEPGACPAWVSLLNRATHGDDSMIAYLQRLCGYVLTGETREECFAFIYGPAQTGKSTFIRVLSEILGDYHSKAQMETFTESKHERHSEEIAVLAGARLVTATETEEGRRWNEARIKTLTGRDRIRARLMYQGSFEFDPQFKLMIAGNHAPHLRNVDDAMRRRLHIIPFTQPIALSERDDQLADKLRAEYPQILSWMIEGALAWKDAKLGRPEQMEQAVSEYMESEDTLGNWLAECAEIKPNARCLSGGAYGSFKRWSATSGEYVPSQKWFVKALKERGFDPKKIGGARYITGLELKPDDNGQVFDEDQGYAVP